MTLDIFTPSSKLTKPCGCVLRKFMTNSSARRASSGLFVAEALDESRFASRTCAGSGGGRIVSEGLTVCGIRRSSLLMLVRVALMLPSGSGDSSIGESSITAGAYLGVGRSAIDMYWSISNGRVWLRGRGAFGDIVVCGKWRAVSGGRGMKGPGAVPESGVKKGEVGLSGMGEKEDGAVSVKALLRDVELWV